MFHELLRMARTDGRMRLLLDFDVVCNDTKFSDRWKIGHDKPTPKYRYLIAVVCCVAQPFKKSGRIDWRAGWRGWRKG